MSARVSASSRTPCRCSSDLPVHETAERRARLAARRRPAAPRTSSTQAARELLVDAAGDALGRHARPASAAPAATTSYVRQAASACPAKCAVSGPPGQEEHLERPHEALPVARLDARRRRGIDAAAACGAGTRRRGGAAIALEPARAARRRARARETGRASARGSRSPSRRRGSAGGRARVMSADRRAAASRANCAAV